MELAPEHVIARIDGYLAGRLAAEEASDWALKVIVEMDFDEYPKNIGYAVMMLFELHDEGETWCPTVEELKEGQRLLLEGENPPASSYMTGTLKSCTRRGILREIETMRRKAKE
jgi:hypothetical protein